MKLKVVKGNRSEQGFALKGAILFITIVATLIVVLAYTFGDVVYPGQLGVRQITLQIPFGPRQGYSKEGLKPGYHWNIPWYSRMHYLPSAIQTMHLHRDTSQYSESPGSLEVQTTDGSSVDVDMSIFYRFYPDHNEKHGGPADVLQRVGQRVDRENYLQTSIVNELKKSLGNLSTSDFYDPKKRENEVLIAQNQLNARLAEVGIKIEAILLRRYTYTEERIDNAIFQKNLQDQEERLNAAASRLAEASAELERVAAEEDEKIKDLRIAKEKESELIRSEADLYEKTKIAQGDLLVAKATAEVNKLKADALAKTLGSDVYVAKELAPLLSSLKGGVVTKLDPYDLEQWLKKLGIGQESGMQGGSSNE